MMSRRQRDSPANRTHRPSGVRPAPIATGPPVVLDLLDDETNVLVRFSGDARAPLRAAPNRRKVGTGEHGCLL